LDTAAGDVNRIGDRKSHANDPRARGLNEPSFARDHCHHRCSSAGEVNELGVKIVPGEDARIARNPDHQLIGAEAAVGDVDFARLRSNGAGTPEKRQDRQNDPNRKFTYSQWIVLDSLLLLVASIEFAVRKPGTLTLRHGCSGLRYCPTEQGHCSSKPGPPVAILGKNLPLFRFL
jgi:hypothetical protein